MENQDLKDMLDSIKLAVKDDYEAGKTVTTYPLPKAAQVDKVLDVLPEHFDNYEKVEVDDDYNLILTHPEKDD
ncbi:hypothetical protein P5E07_22915 [Vibrio parahaemolyticus]|uniref:Uncharacterized protein n=1 Tax=Vibrio parahaemolyticus TaxID=670 RepID=A0A7Y0X616_VIBPH|nr:hypothetical protein [Vibrio parahaemolyticus]EJE4150136.1 hypothetical protein [Vibrio parahaemolyticus]ELU0552395.1 hypothetical protein [Vibrio parahaemolyticus]MCZ6279458.1 hypothetical protein [Vibrio parahaemolyticus]MDF5242332.1 hypothetical protein [Vibrio parahaemolyticus]MDF5495803.1 hypothetical protein [Vibrio parahaemolyticus]